MSSNGPPAALTTIERALRRLDRHVLLSSLRPGISNAGVREALRSVDLPVTPGLVSLYGWRDGTETFEVAAADDIQILPGFYLLSLEDAIVAFRVLSEDPRWHPQWLPVFTNGGGDFYLVDLGESSAGAVRHFRLEESVHPVEFSSLESMLATIAEAFSEGVFFVDADGHLEMNDSIFGELAAKLNPEVVWWR